MQELLKLKQHQSKKLQIYVYLVIVFTAIFLSNMVLAKNLVAISKGVSNLRSVNAPVGANGSYIAVIDPAFEFAIQEQIALAGGTTISSLSDIGNRALLNGLVGQAAGCVFFRSNNLPNA